VGFNTLMLPPSLRSNLSAFLDGGEIDELSREADREWPIYDHHVICQRYNRIAAFIPFFEYAFFIPSGLRKRAVDRLKLRQGDRVLEVGCGTGRNFQFLRDAVGPEGRIYGVDLSEGMLRRARKLCQRRQWTNFVLIKADAADYASQELFDGALFSFSYNVMPHHRSVLRQVWKQLRPGGRLVIMDARLPPGLFGKLIRPFATWLMKQTLLGNPLIRPWQYHAALVDDFQMEDFRFGSYYICCGTKPELDVADRRLLPASSRRPRADHRSPSQRSRRKPDKLKTASAQRNRH
jgi:SAM-dependent methyltransferase